MIWRASSDTEGDLRYARSRPASIASKGRAPNRPTILGLSAFSLQPKAKERKKKEKKKEEKKAG